MRHGGSNLAAEDAKHGVSASQLCPSRSFFTLRLVVLADEPGGVARVKHSSLTLCTASERLD